MASQHIAFADALLKHLLEESMWKAARNIRRVLPLT
jgi:hypothetical protein